MKARFNLREIETLPVMVSFLLKGNPTTRIAEYCVTEKKMTPAQVQHFVSKLSEVPLRIRKEIYQSAKLISERGVARDAEQTEGYNLRRWLESLNA